MKSKQNLYGQFNTNKHLSEFLLNKIDEYKPITGNILEPSFGEGMFIDNLLAYNISSITGIEIDSKLFNNYKSPDDKVNLFNKDFFLAALTSF